MRTKAVVRVTLLVALGLTKPGPAAPQPPPPRLLFTDIESGPGVGGLDGLGAFVTVYGKGLGATRGSSTVTIGGRPVGRVVSWGLHDARDLERIVAQLGPAATSGDIVVTVAGQASNGLPFTVRAGDVYFVHQASGNDGNPGSFARPWATLWRARDTLAAGDVVYVRGGTFDGMDPAMPGWDTLLFLDTSLAASGTAAAPIAILGYPGDPPLLANSAARRGIYLNQDSGALSHYVLGNLRFREMGEAVLVTGTGHRVVGNDFFAGGEGDKVGVFGDTSAIAILGNRFAGNGTPETKYYAIYVQGFGVNRDVEIGWNEVRDQEGRSIQVYGHLAGDFVDQLHIHDNVLVGAELDNLLLGGSDGGSEILGAVSVTGNVIAGARAGAGLRVNDPAGTVVIENNTLVDNAQSQVYLEEAGAGRVTLRDNVLVAGPGQPYYQLDAGASPASFVPARNLVFGGGPCEPWDTGCVHRDPLFAGAADYHLRPGSPAIDAGVATAAARDHDGVERPQGAAYDIGAFEYHQLEVRRCSPSATVLCVDDEPGDRRFEIQVAYETVQAGGASGLGHAVPLSALGVRQGGLFWFFAPDNPEMLVKVLAGGSHFWVFYSAGTNVGLTTTVTDTVSGNRVVYRNGDRHAALPVQHTSAFRADGTLGAPHVFTETSFDYGRDFTQTTVAPSTCVPDAGTLCIRHRFAVQVAYETVQGGGLAGAGQALPLASQGIADGGLFWFFAEANPEMLVKVLDACALDDRYWVFFSAGTNVGYTLTVTDTLLGTRNEYRNRDLNAAPPVQDTLRALPCTAAGQGAP